MAQKTIHLNYDLANWTMTAATRPATGTAAGAAAAPAAALKPGQMSTIKAKEGDALDWVVDNTNITDFVVHLEPASTFEPATFSRSSGPVKVVKKIKNGHAYCGFVSGGKLYGYPKDKSYGHSFPDEP